MTYKINLKLNFLQPNIEKSVFQTFWPAVFTLTSTPDLNVGLTEPNGELLTL